MIKSLREDSGGKEGGGTSRIHFGHAHFDMEEMLKDAHHHAGDDIMQTSVYSRYDSGE